MRRFVPAAALVALLASCSGGTPVSTQRYYDPAGLFSAQLPSANDVLVMPAQAVEGSAPLLSGVLSLPPQPSPSPGTSAFGSSFLQPATQQDTAIYEVVAVKADPSSSVVDLGSKLLSATVDFEVVSERRIRVGGIPGVLAVADHHDQDGGLTYTDASAFFIDGNVGYWIRELFALGDWDSREEGFLQILRSFQPNVPAGLPAVPLSRPGIEVRSGIGWPLG